MGQEVLTHFQALGLTPAALCIDPGTVGYEICSLLGFFSAVFVAFSGQEPLL